MRRQVLLDTGAIVALLKRQDQFHDWAKAEWAIVIPPFLTCEAVITEACFLLRRTYGGQEAVLSLIKRGFVQVAFNLGDEADAISELLTRYQSVPMSLADACLVRMSELYAESLILTLDSDFMIYRRNRNQAIPVIMPPQSI
jgi:uncharacterized protein